MLRVFLWRPRLPRIGVSFLSGSGAIQVETRGKVRVIGINRPGSRNAINPKAANDLYQAFRAFDSDPAVHVAVLHGVGGNFCAGYDLKELASTATGAQIQLPKDIGEFPSPMVCTNCIG